MIFLRLCVVALAIVAATVSSSLGQSLDIAPVPNKITAVIPYDLPPTYFLDKKTNAPAGFAVDIMNAIAERSGLGVNYIFGETWTDILGKILNGNADVIPDLGINEERSKYFLFTSPIEVYNVCFFVRSKSPITTEPTETDTIGVIQESVAHDLLKKRSIKYLLTYNNFEHAFFDLLAGKIDVLAAPVPTVVRLSQESGVEDKIRMINPPIAEVKRAVAVRKDNPELLLTLNRTIAEFIGEPEYQRIYKKWYGSATPYWTARRIVILSTLASFLVICMMAAWRYYSLFILNHKLMNSISERNQAEQTLRESEARFRDFFENVSDLIQSVSPEGSFIYVNRAWRDTLGYSEEETHKISFLDIIHPDCHNHCIDIFHRIMSGENINKVEVTFIARNSRPVILEGTINCKFEDGKPIATRGIFRDITKRKQIEEQLNKVSHYNELILNSTGEGILGVDLDGNHTFVNPEAARMLGYTADELLGRHSHSVWHHTKADGSPYPEEDCPIYAAIKNGTIYRRVRDEIFWTKNNSCFPVAYTSTPIIDTSSIVGAVLTFRDISVHKQTEDALHESESRLRTILETVQAGIILIDAETHTIVDVNSVAAKLIGKPKENIIGSICHNYICPAEVGRCPITDLGHVVDNSERVLITSDGIRMPVIKTVVPIMLKGQRHILESFVDLSEQKKLERQLLHSQKMDAIGQLAGGVAHDFNNILSAIIGSAHLASMKIQEDNTARQDISQILESAQRATALTQSLLAFGRRQLVNLQVYDINEIINTFEKFLLRIIREDIDLRTALYDGRLPIMADKVQVEQIIMNLVTNARDAMPYGGELIVETKRIMIDEQFIKSHGYGELDEYACISVSDSGVGMNEATKRKIFEPFFTTKEVGKGTGLGLAVAYGIVKKHHGYINVASEEGKGSTFNVFLPITKVANEIKEDKRPENVPARCGSETILVAEDDYALRKLTTTVLSHHGYKVITAIDGEDAVETFAANSKDIDMVILDGIMPRKNGKDAYKDITRLRPDIKVVFTSGYSEDIFNKEDFTIGNTIFVQKPVSPSDLLRTVRESLDSS